MPSCRAACRNPGGKHGTSTEELDASARMFSRMLRTDAVREQKFRCIYCQDRLTLKTATADHAMPRSRGGATDRKNIKGACAPCNQAKGNGTDAWFRRVLNGGDIPLADPQLTAAFVRFRLNRRTERAEKRIRDLVGMAA